MFCVCPIGGFRYNSESFMSSAAKSEPTRTEFAISEKEIRFAFGVFFFFLAAYLITWGGHYTSGDGAQKIAWAKAMLSGASSGVSPSPNGIYSKYGIGHSLIAMPALAIASFLRSHTGIRSEAALYTLIFVFNGAILLALIAYYLSHFYARRQVLWVVGVIGLATTWWPYTKLDFSEPLVTTLLFAGFVLMRFGRPMTGMLTAAFTITIRPDAGILVALLALWFLLGEPGRRNIIKITVPVLPWIAVVAWSNYTRYHSIFDHGYANEGFTTPVLIGLEGILFSPGKSIFVFSPPLVLGFLGWRRFWRNRALRADAGLFLAIFSAELLTYAKWWDWSSDDAWGIRFMIPAVVIMCIPAVEVVERRARLAAGLALCGVIIQLIPVLVGGLDYLLLVRNHEAKRTALYLSGLNRVDFEDIRFNPRYSQIAGSWILLRHMLHMPPRAGAPDASANSGTPLYETLPAAVWSEAAQWDFFWTRRTPPGRQP